MKHVHTKGAMIMSQKIGVVDVGGGYRGIYAAGVLDYCLDHGIHFDLGIGVSAGSANIASYTAGQARRNRQFYSEFGLRKEYASAGNFFRKRSFLDLDYVYGTLSNSDGESPLDYEAIMRNPAEMITVATKAETGQQPEPFGLTTADIEKLERAIDILDSELPPLRNFVLPGGCRAASIAHLCRTICRRCERRIITLQNSGIYIHETIIKYINRLSDFFFILARFNNIHNQIDEIFWNKDC